MIITKKALPRRTFLKGVGAALALPLLDAMIPAATALTIGVSCVYRHADGSPIPATMENADFAVTRATFAQAGHRWYLHAHKQARQVVGCQPTLSRSVYPTHDTD